ncbi:TetR family transcriptional regulator [Nonomuraea sp. NPDC048882]|uniref:TetR/AcrR family transcriptional regulator n=1 Tax=unclassified Nonomuraea TaxID=2593643 RepID=UPI0033C2881A
MAKRTAKRAPRRTDGLSREVIVQAAIDLLDEGGVSALTLRALTIRLSTGYGAVYHHVTDKNDLLAAAADDVIARVLSGAVVGADPPEALRGVALGLFDAIDAHPWVGAELSRQPWRPALLDFYESVGRLLHALAVPERARFDAAGALVNYVLGVAAQNAAQNAARTGRRPARDPDQGPDRDTDRDTDRDPDQGPDRDTDRDTDRGPDQETGRADFLAGVAEQWSELDPGRYPFVHEAATRLREHDDRDQFLAGVDIFLAGIATLRRP